MSLILTSILGTTSQATISKEYMDYIWTNLENNTDFNTSENYNTNFKSYLQQLTEEQKNSVKTKINQYLSANRWKFWKRGTKFRCTSVSRFLGKLV